MNMTHFGMLGWPEMVAILAIALLIFGARKLPELARGLGQGIKEFRKATREVTDDLHAAMDEEPPPPKAPRRPASPAPSRQTNEAETDETLARSSGDNS